MGRSPGKHVLEEPRVKKPPLVEFVEWIEEIVLVASVLVLLFFFLPFQINVVEGISMEPTYFDGDVVVSLESRDLPQVGDVVIVDNVLPMKIIKRVIATAGQTVDFDEATNEVLVDGKPLSSQAFGLKPGITKLPAAGEKVMDFPQTVPENCVFVLGDNRPRSEDSRYRRVGMVDVRNISGVVRLNLFPLTKFGVLPDYTG